MPASRNPRTFGEWLRRRREQQDLTQWVLAERAGCSFSTVCKLESDGRKPSHEMALRLIDVLNLPLEERAAVLELVRSNPRATQESNLTAAGTSRKARRAASARHGGRVIYTRSELAIPQPAFRTPFVGRDAGVAAICSLLGKEDVRLLTLMGPPGIGKTRLGVRAAEQMAGRLADGVALVFLSETNEIDMVLPEMASALGVDSLDGKPVLESLKAHLREREMLLVLDNFEQVTGAGYALGRLLDACPSLKVMVMSRAALDVYGEHLFVVPGMSVPAPDEELSVEQALRYEAIALFEQRSRAANSAFRLTEQNVSLVAEICRRLDGLPLAIELAASRSLILNPTQIVARLDRRLDLLTAGPSDLPARQHSLRAAIDWSYELLSEDERRLFCWMSVFPGAVTLDVVDAVCEGAPPDGEARQQERRFSRSILDLMGSLFGKSLVQRSESEGEARYYLLGTMREYAHERLVQSGEQQAAVERCGEYYGGLLDGETQRLRGLRL